MRRLFVTMTLGLGLWTGCASSRATRDSGESDRASGNRGYLEEGLASFYGPGLNGQPTASGEKLDPRKLTAAHRTLPFGTCLKVVNMENGRSVEVRVNDRGPHVKGRVVDVSQAGAERLDLVKKGLARVRLYRCESRTAWLALPSEAEAG
jgi:rare lipoprotein A